MGSGPGRGCDRGVVADAAFDAVALWPAHDWDGWEEPLPLKSLYVGAAGVIWGLDALRRRGHACATVRFNKHAKGNGTPS